MEHIVHKIIEQKKIALFLKTGYGKTRIVLSAISRLLEAGEVKRVIIIAPLLVANKTWSDEIVECGEEISNIDLMICTGGRQRRYTALTNTDANVFIINVENVTWMVDHNLFDFDMVVIDESSKFKDPKTKRFKSLRKVFEKCDRRVLMSGTPMSNGVQNLWSQTYLLDGGERLGTSYARFRLRYFYRVSKFKYQLYSGAEARIMDLVSDLCYSEIATHVEKIKEEHIHHPVIMSAEARKIYDSIKNDFIYELSEGFITAAHAGIVLNKLLQICGGSVYLEDRKCVQIHEGKLAKLHLLIDYRFKGDSIIVVYNYNFERDKLREEFPHSRMIKKPQDITDWNEGKIEMALVHPASAGHGLNLQFGGNKIVWYGKTWSLENFIQTNASYHPYGTTRRSH